MLYNSTFLFTNGGTSQYDYIFNSNTLIQQGYDVTATSTGTVDSIVVENPGTNYQVLDRVSFDTTQSDGSGLDVRVASVTGKPIQTISVATTTFTDVEFKPYNNNTSFVGYTTYPHDLLNKEKIIVNGLTDYFDGYLARKYSAVSQLGEILDPIADKILVLFVLFGLAINLSSYLIGFIGAIVITREIWVGALRDLNARNGKSDATKVTFLAKIKTSVQLLTLSIYLFGLAINNMLIIVIADILLFISLFITLYTGLIYTLKTFKKNEEAQ